MRSGFGNFNRKRLARAGGLLLLAVSFCRLAGIGAEYWEGADFYRRLGQSAAVVTTEGRRPGKDKEEGENGGLGGETVAGTGDGIPEYRHVEIDFSYLKGMNEDIVGWLLFDRSGIGYPVLQGRDNDEYLHMLPDKTKNDAGSIFMDALCGQDFEDMHTILYGHNRKDGTMFGMLKKYGAQPDYYGENRFFTIYTPAGCFRYEVFAWYEAGADDAVYQVGFASDQEYGNFVAQMQKRGGRNKDITVGREDKVVTLSTCSVMDRRFVVHGKRMEGEEK